MTRDLHLDWLYLEMQANEGEHEALQILQPTQPAKRDSIYPLSSNMIQKIVCLIKSKSKQGEKKETKKLLRQVDENQMF